MLWRTISSASNSLRSVWSNCRRFAMPVRPSDIACSASFTLAAARSIWDCLRQVTFFSVPVSPTVTPFSTMMFGVLTGLLWLSTVPPTSGLIGVMFGTKYFSTLYGMAFLSHQVGGFLVIQARPQRFLHHVPLRHVAFHQRPQQQILGWKMIGNAATGDAALLDQLVIGEIARTLLLNDAFGGLQDFFLGGGGAGHDGFFTVRSV